MNMIINNVFIVNVFLTSAFHGLETIYNEWFCFTDLSIDTLEIDTNTKFYHDFHI